MVDQNQIVKVVGKANKCMITIAIESFSNRRMSDTFQYLHMQSFKLVRGPIKLQILDALGRLSDLRRRHKPRTK